MDASYSLSDSLSDSDDADIEADLSALIKEYGLIDILSALRNLVEAKAERLENHPDQLENQQAEAFRDVARALTVLVKALPPELDVEIALEQITHTSRDLDSDRQELILD